MAHKQQESIVLEAGNSRSRCQPGQVLERTFFQVAGCSLLVVSPHGGRDKGACPVAFIRALISFMIVPPS